MAGTFKWKWRVAIFLFYAVGLAIANKQLFGEFLPPESKLSISFLSFLFASLIVQPHYISPKDSLSNTASIVFVIIPLLFGSEVVRGDARYLWEYALLLAFAIALLSASVTIIDGAGWRRLFSKAVYTLTITIGSPRVLFTGLHFLILYSFYSETDLILGLSVAWVVVAFGQPVERILHLVQQAMVVLHGAKNRAIVLGEVVSRHHPKLLTIRVAGEEHPQLDSLVLVPTSPSSFQVGVVLDNYRLADELWSRALVVREDILSAQWPEISGPTNVALRCSESVRETLDSEDEDFLTSLSRVIGSVKEDSDLSLAQIELYRDGVTLVEGQVLCIEIQETPVLYQIIGGATESEALENSNRHGFMRVEARKMGYWNPSSSQIEPVPWTPNIYSPVFMVPQEAGRFRRECIGFLPGTDSGIEVSCNELVTHNTAILGVLGSGKTSLAVELVRRMVVEGIDVWIVDITGEYEKQLKDLLQKEKQDQVDESIRNAILHKAQDTYQNKESGGNHLEFAHLLNEHIGDFKNDKTWRVRVINPTSFVVTEQTSGYFNRSAGIGELTPAQITRKVAEELLKCFQDKLEVSARICLVLEEAHSLVPEWNSVASDGDKNATNGTARAIMQGRKYGFGCLLVTQRTANVTKSILNQCNTMFALQVFDDTGKVFLQNYFGEEFANMLPALQERNCVAFGKGVKTKTPVLINLNDRSEVRKHFGPPPETTESAVT